MSLTADAEWLEDFAPKIPSVTGRITQCITDQDVARLRAIAQRLRALAVQEVDTTASPDQPQLPGVPWGDFEERS